MPGSASTTYGTAFTTRIAVASMAPAPLLMCAMPASAGSFSVGVTQQSMSGLPSNVIRYVRSASPIGQSVPTWRASRVM